MTAVRAAEEETYSRVDDVRSKDFELRTLDERRFVGLDLIINPDAYVRVFFLYFYTVGWNLVSVLCGVLH